MKITATRLAAVVVLAMVSGLLFGQELQAQKAAKVLRYEDLERMALENNPTLKQAEARIRAVEGKLKQAGIYPNPSIGYTGDERASAASKTSSPSRFQKPPALGTSLGPKPTL